jgi:NAD(P)-dependent dehydrogenase (short-subunit alcohol dehydrogenase family)
MNKNIALVTGATSGLGYSAARQLAEGGWGQVIITGRKLDRASQTGARLTGETDKNVFSAVELDLNTPESVQAAAAELADRGDEIDFLLLNAGMISGNERVITDEGIEITYASSLIGHHQLTMQLLAGGVLAPDARIVIAGSEAARGDVPTFNVVDLSDYATKSHNGDRVAAAEALIRSDSTVRFKPANTYATAKLFVAWWAQALARKLPDGMAVYAVSPGSAPNTEAARNANFFMKRIMIPTFKLIPGKAASVDDAAERYLQAADFGNEVSGEFFASAPKKMIGPIEVMQHDHFHDQTDQEAAWDAVVKAAGGVDYPVSTGT